MNADREHPSLEDEASAALLQPLQGEWTREEQTALEARLSADREYARAYGRVEKVWAALGAHAGSPELMRRREEAIAYARGVSGRRWLRPSRRARARWYAAAAACGAALVAAAVWQLSPAGYRPGQFHTGIGELRTVELDDHSRITMDAATRLQVRYSTDARMVELHEGQAQFSVAPDPMRPFKVKAGDRTIVALGTTFTVELVDRQVRVAMLEGRVAVVVSAPAASASNVRPAPHTVELAAGEEIRINRAGRTVLTHQADLEAATAWRDGKVIFRSEPLDEAVRRLNRYSRVQIEIVDPALAAERISGVFEVGNTPRFVDALQRSLPVAMDSSGTDRISIRLKQLTTP